MSNQNPPPVGVQTGSSQVLNILKPPTAEQHSVYTDRDERGDSRDLFLQAP